MLCLRHRSDWTLLVLFESSSVPFVPLGLGGLNLPAATFDLGVEGDCLLRGRLCFWAVGDCNLVSPRTDMERLVVLFTETWSLFCSLSITFPFSHGRAAIHRSNQLQPQRGLFGSINVWFAEFEEFLQVCWYRKFDSMSMWLLLFLTKTYKCIMRYWYDKQNPNSNNEESGFFKISTSQNIFLRCDLFQSLLQCHQLYSSKPFR